MAVNFDAQNTPLLLLSTYWPSGSSRGSKIEESTASSDNTHGFCGHEWAHTAEHCMKLPCKLQSRFPEEQQACRAGSGRAAYGKAGRDQQGAPAQQQDNMHSVPRLRGRLVREDPRGALLLAPHPSRWDLL